MNSPNAPSASGVNEPADRFMDLFERRIDWAERFGTHHGGPHHQEAGASGIPQAGQVAVVGGEAVAAGQDTLATGLVQSVAEDKGSYSIIVGDAIFEASARSSEPGGAAAGANTFLTVSGTDFIIKYEDSHGAHGPNAAWASSELYYVALDIDGWSPRGGPVVIELHQPGHQSQVCGQEPPHGNYADVMAKVEAHSSGSLSATLTNALTGENQFSFVNAIGVVAV
jgi:hypothetical protein